MKRSFLYLLSIVSAITACTKKADVQADTTGTKTGNNITAPVTELTSNFKGLNWADPNDNFADAYVVPSGLSTADNYSAVQTKAENILTAFQQRGANTVRLPVNPYTVSNSWWSAYTGAIDKATSKGMKVVLAYWEGASSRDGLVDDLTSFWAMWQTVVARYNSNSNVYFEVFNEPHGYSVNDLKNLYAQWMTNNPSVAAGRIVLDGAGYATNVNDIGSDSRFANCLLSYHNYTWFDNNKTTVADWEQAINGVAYPDRTIMTEFGIPMTNGKDYLGAPGTDREIAYFQGVTNGLRARSMGGIYWPGLRNGDSYSLLTLSGSTLTTNNASGLTRLQYGWNNTSITPVYGAFDSNAWYRIVCRNSNKALDVNGSSTSDGGSIIQWEYWGGNNQQWKFTSLGNGYFTITNRNSNKVLDVSGASTSNGTGIVQNTGTGAQSQQWQITDMGFGYYKIINRNSSISLDVNGNSTVNGAGVIQWPWNAGANQQWQIVKL